MTAEDIGKVAAAIGTLIAIFWGSKKGENSSEGKQKSDK